MAIVRSYEQSHQKDGVFAAVMVATGCQVNAAIEEALREAAPSYEARGIRVEAHLDCSVELVTEDDVLEASLATIFRALPDRVVPGSLLQVWTRDRAGGDVELVWDVSEPGPPAPAVARPQDPNRDLLDLAVEGLTSLCRARHGVVELDAERLQLAPAVARRYLFLIPSLRRDPAWHPFRRS